MGDVQRTRLEVAEIIERFLDGTGGCWDWDDFCSHKITDPELESVRDRCSRLDIFYPPVEKGHYCGEAGFEIMRQLVVKLRTPR
jgi:hypothetical protein